MNEQRSEGNHLLEQGLPELLPVAHICDRKAEHALDEHLVRHIVVHAHLSQQHLLNDWPLELLVQQIQVRTGIKQVLKVRHLHLYSQDVHLLTRHQLPQHFPELCVTICRVRLFNERLCDSREGHNVAHVFFKIEVGQAGVELQLVNQFRPQH
jgi:hypothetical protein